MKYLLQLRWWLRKHPYFATIFGGVVFVLSAAAAIFLRFAYFYSTFVVGLFLFFDAATHLMDKSLSFTSNLERVGRTFWSVIAGFIVLTDLIGAQIVFKVWEYPPYHSWINWALLYVVIFPVGGLSVIAMYRFFNLLFGKFFPGKFFQVADPAVLSGKILRAIFFGLPLALIVPLILYFSGTLDIVVRSQLLYSLLFLFLFLEWTFFFDVLILALGGRPTMLDFIHGDKKTILAVVVSGLLGAGVHELINTYVYEWVYIANRFPVTTATFLGVPIMVFVTWIPLSIVCVQAYRFGQVVREKGFLRQVVTYYR